LFREYFRVRKIYEEELNVLKDEIDRLKIQLDRDKHKNKIIIKRLKDEIDDLKVELDDEEKSNMRWICRRIYNWDLIYQIEDYPDVSRNKKSEIENIKTMCGEIPHTLPTRVKNNLVSYLSGPVGSHTNHFPDDYRTIYQPKPYIGELKQKIMKDQNAGRGKTRKTRKTHKFRLRVARNKQRCKTKAIKKKRPFTKK
jgi:hypothetical protein